MASHRPAGDRYRVEEYFGLVDLGLIAPDERVELLHGLIVSMAPQQPLHAAVVSRLTRLLSRVVLDKALVRVQLPLIAGTHSAPEPDIALVPPRADDYAAQHPREALLVIEVTDRSLGQDRLTKSRIYAAAGIADYWIVNLRDSTVDWFRCPDTSNKVYEESGTATNEDALQIQGLEGVRLRVKDLFPPH